MFPSHDLRGVLDGLSDAHKSLTKYNNLRNNNPEPYGNKQEFLSYTNIIGKTFKSFISYPCGSHIKPTAYDSLHKTVIAKLEGDEGNVIFSYCPASLAEIWLGDICGDFEDILNSPILKFEKRSNFTSPPLLDGKYCDDDDEYVQLWTFYEIATIKGSVTLRFIGQDEGYYSKMIDIDLIKKDGKR